MLPDLMLPDPAITAPEGREELSARRRAQATSSYIVKTIVWLFPESSQTTCPATLPQPKIGLLSSKSDVRSSKSVFPSSNSDVQSSNSGILSSNSGVLSSSSSLLPISFDLLPSSSSVLPTKPGIRGSSSGVLSSKSPVLSSDSGILSFGDSEALRWIQIAAGAIFLVVFLPTIIMRRKWKRRQVVIRHRNEMQRLRARNRIEQRQKTVHGL